MGSSKKHKEKDKDRERRHKHKDRDKDRDRERKHKSKHRHRDRHAEKEIENEKKDIEAGEVSSPEQKPEQKSDRKRRRSPSSPQIKLEKAIKVEDNERQEDTSGGGGSGGFAESLSIAETNKLRAKLGLAPLEVNDGEGGSGEPGEIVEEKPDVHKPAVNISEVKKREALKEKMALIREKRLINKKLHKVKVLADDDDDDDAAAWVERMRKKQMAKAEADRRAKMLEEMDAEFGIGKIVEDEFSKTKERNAYSRKNLEGFKVEHSLKNFNEGQSVILTLKDMDALQEEEDVLVNVNMIDNEKAKKNVELKKKKPDYKAYQEDDFDEEGMFRHKTLLGKYDEEIEGEQRKSFRLDQAGGANYDDEDHMDSIRSQLRKQAVSLYTEAPTVASEYYTPTEMETFKKPKKKRRKLKAKSIAEELTPVTNTGRDHGARGGIRRRHREEDEDEAPREQRVPVPQQDAMDMEVDFPDADQVPIEFGRARDGDDDIWGQVIEDEAEKELHNVLNKARKLKQKSKSSQRVEDQVARVVANIKEEPEDEESMAASSSAAGASTAAASNRGSNIIFNSTSEFCRTLGDIPSYGKSGLRDEEEENMVDFEKEDEEEETMEDGEEGEEAAGAWNTVSMEEREEIKKEKEEELGPVLDDEPTLQGGIAGALSLATKKGYLIQEKKKKTGDSLILTAKNFTIENKNFNDIDSKYNKHDRFRGPISDFKEKSGYKPEVKITYTDESGRSLNQKEAFRVLSHRFHGKGSGKMKTEKRAKKVLEEEAMKKMSSTDTPLNTVARMQEKQKTLQSAYIVLSGGSKTMTAHSITK